jgi:ADP-ribosyl-[dinitrogen reductase] hydrolase
MDLIDRYKGCLAGLAIGDAVGTTVEFLQPGEFTPVTDMYQMAKESKTPFLADLFRISTWESSSQTTHASNDAISCCILLGSILEAIFDGVSRDQLADKMNAGNTASEKLLAVVEECKSGELAKMQVKGSSGYCIESMRSALWGFYTTENYKDCILAVTNLGYDSDTNAAIAGQIAGAYYGFDSFPPEWTKKLYARNYILELAQQLHDVSAK